MKSNPFAARALETSIAIALTLACGAAAPVLAATVPLDPAPPDLLKAVAPNIALTFDDSGSMARAYMPDSIGAGSAFDSAATGPGTIHSAPFYFSGANKLYYDPAITYVPPLRSDGVTRFPDADYAGAWRDGLCANVPANGSEGARCAANAVDLSKAFFQGFDSFDGQSDYPAYTNSQVASRFFGKRNIPAAVRTSGSALLDGGFYYTRSAAGEYSIVSVNGQNAEKKKSFANWYSYYRTRSLMARSGITSAFAKRDDKVRVTWQNLNSNGFADDTTIEAFAGTKRNNFFGWLNIEKASGGTPNRVALDRALKFFRSGYANGKGTGTNGRFNPYWENIAGQANGGMELTCRQNFHLLVTDGYWNGGGPAVADVKPRVSASFKLPDERNYAPGTAHTRVYSNENRSNGGNADPSLADIAFQGWASDLRTDLDNNVSPFLTDATTGVTGPVSTSVDEPFQNDEVYFNPANDPATWQHLVNFTVGLGLAGQLRGSTPAEVASTMRTLRTGTQWPVPPEGGEDLRKLDDTWHAAVNSRGTFLSASNPQQLVDGLDNVLRAVTANRDSATTVSAVSSAFSTADVFSFGTSYSSLGWVGDVTAKTGSRQAWKAAAQLTSRAPADRRLITAAGPGKTGVPLRFDKLTALQQATLDKNPASASGSSTRRENPANWTTDNLGARRLDYLRGDRSSETAAPNFRPRRSLLGSIINSQPLYVSSAGGLRDAFPFDSPEHKAYEDGNSYEQFLLGQRNRAPMIYVGSSAGFMHALDARTGKELWAYMPGTLIENGRATRQTLAGGELVPGPDDLLIANDVFINGQWRTVLVGSLRLGGRAVFALDITERGAVSNETDQAGRLLWEFSNKSDGGANLGYTYGSTNIVRLNNGKWVVAVSSGYFPTDGLDSDDPAAKANSTSLILIDLESGKVIRELTTPAGVTSYGMSRPGAYDLDEDFVSDVMAAGDLAGNLWRFDLTSDKPEEWSVRQLFKTYTKEDDIGKQPISVMPLAMGDRKTMGAVWIFGTGKFIGAPDRLLNGMATQAFYGVRDGAAGVATPAALVEQVLSVGSEAGLRNLTSNDVPEKESGWRIDLKLAPGERNVVTATALDASNLVVLASLIPTGGGDPCSSGREGSLMIVDATTGGVAYEEVDKLTPKVRVPGGDKETVGKTVTNPPMSGNPLAQVEPGGGAIGISYGDIEDIEVKTPYWHRDGWRELFNPYDN